MVDHVQVVMVYAAHVSFIMIFHSSLWQSS